MNEEENKNKEMQPLPDENADKEEETGKEAEKPNGDNNEALVRKILFALCYLWGILFFLPLLMYKDDEEAKLHANQGLVLLLIAIVGNAVCGILTGVFGGTVVGTVFGILIGIFNVLMLLLGIFGIVNVVTENGKTLPFIGNIKLIK